VPSELHPAEKSNVNKHTRVYPKVSRLSHSEIYAYNNKHAPGNNTKDYGGKTH
jgi:hypothetical protein